ncbi:uncharacterized protein LOC119336238 isoform X2 [Triticum dicoccoides]|uniref:uncharacterized protein LOC119336238 isoform X2 n=1 Tax=Triticum dicoccoides TaxID=85692 RepID=UPI00189150EC|nr:uncharacterized protein LOC119336238 isoform X2 [Triticum dicoccoides]
MPLNLLKFLDHNVGSAKVHLTRGAAGKKDMGEAFFVFMGSSARSSSRRTPRTSLPLLQSSRWEVEELERVDHGVPALQGRCFLPRTRCPAP